MKIAWFVGAVACGFLTGCGGAKADEEIIVPPPDVDASVSAEYVVMATRSAQNFDNNPPNPHPTPQSVKLLTGPSTFIVVSNCYVGPRPEGADPWILFRHGSRILNLTIPNPSLGVTLCNTSIRAPISADGTLLAAILCDSFVTPPAYWNGHYFPNGILVKSSPDSVFLGQFSQSTIGLTATVSTGPTGGDQRSGQGTQVSSSIYNQNAVDMKFLGSDGSEIRVNSVGTIYGVTGQSVQTTVPWRTRRSMTSTGAMTFEDATINIILRY